VDQLAALYRRHAGPLVFYAQSLSRDRALAEDVVQEAFLRMLDRDPARIESVKAFLYATVRHLVIDERRRDAARAQQPPALASRPSCTPVCEATLESISSALGGLPPEQREVVVLKTYAGMTLAEAARLTGVSEATATSRYRYAIEKLAGLLCEVAR
jgi:RNA polymerase sigma-70 factor (ECF subfamily)